MTDKEMMEEALEWQEHIRKLITATDDELYHKRSKVFDWLLERVQDLKIMLKVLGERNQRYKHALEEILNADCNLEGLDAERELDRVTDIALKALESDEN